MYSIKHLFHINASKEKVFEAISIIDGLSNWWTTKSTGETSPGGALQFRFGALIWKRCFMEYISFMLLCDG